MKETVLKIPNNEIRPFKDRPFKVTDDAQMQQLTDSVNQVGGLTPTIVRPLPEGGYEMVSGHRRMHAAESAGLSAVPAIVRNLDDDEARILMADSNLQREAISPMEKARAYKMRMEAMRHQGQRTDLTSGQVGEKSYWAVAQLSTEAKESQRQVHRYLRLNELIPQLQEITDTGKLPLNIAVELSYLTPMEQHAVVAVMEATHKTPTLAQARRLKQCSREGGCSRTKVQETLSTSKNRQTDGLHMDGKMLSPYFPKEYTPAQMHDTIVQLLEQWHKKKQRQSER